MELETLGVCIFVASIMYGLYAIFKGKPAFKVDYWAMVVAMIIGMILILP